MFNNAVQRSGVKPDKVLLSFDCRLSPRELGFSGVWEVGARVDGYIELKGIQWDAHVGSSVIDMYGSVDAWIYRCLDLP